MTTTAVKSKQLAGELLFTRVSADDKTATGTAVQTISALACERSMVMAQVRALEGQRVTAKHALCGVVATGGSSIEARSEIGRLDAEVAQAVAVAKQLDEFIHEVRATVISRDSAALFAQIQDQFSATLAALPQTTESTL